MVLYDTGWRSGKGSWVIELLGPTILGGWRNWFCQYGSGGRKSNLIVCGFSIERERPWPKLETTLAPAVFFDYLTTLTEQDWQHHTVWLYRLWPRTTPIDPAAPRYLRRYHSAFTLDTIALELGGGRYFLVLRGESQTARTIHRTTCDVGPVPESCPKGEPWQ